MNSWRAIGIPIVCGLIAVAIGSVNIWLGVLATPILYSISRRLLSE